MASTFDFIVVGAGASGCVVASRLANSESKPSVLLLEAGGDYRQPEYLSGTNRFQHAFDPNSPLSWGYKAAPQNHLAGQEIDYNRGKALGGSTAINFCAWTVGPRDDYEEWARLVGDGDFGWENVKKCLKRIERIHPEIPDPKMTKYLDASQGDHGTTGKLDIAYGDRWVSDVEDIFVASEQSGLPINKDVNSGDPIGMGMGAVCIYDGKRLTSATAYLSNPPANLTITTNTLVAQVLVENGLATGVQTADGQTYTAKKEVILSGGALNTPQILLLSGIGPLEEVQKHGIPVTKELPMVGRNLQDHCVFFVGIELERKAGAGPADAISQYPTPMGWFKLPAVLESKEFHDLPEEIKQFMSKPTVPTYELASHGPAFLLTPTPDPERDYMTGVALLCNPQSSGTVTLRSSNPSDKPIIDPKFATHPYDRRALIESVRQIVTVLSAPVFAERIVKRFGPSEDADDDTIFEFLKSGLSSSWHMSCTVKMGKNERDACVDANFKVFGIKGLRVVDASVFPFVINNHIQATAYVLGEIAAEKLATEYSLGNQTQ